jgi:hypothetical protein
MHYTTIFLAIFTLIAVPFIPAKGQSCIQQGDVCDGFGPEGQCCGGELVSYIYSYVEVLSTTARLELHRLANIAQCCF